MKNTKNNNQEKKKFNKYSNEIEPIMMIPGMIYLLQSTSIQSKKIEIMFSSWNNFPNDDAINKGVTMNYMLKRDNYEIEYKLFFKKIIKGKFEGLNNFIFYKDYDDMINFY